MRKRWAGEWSKFEVSRRAITSMRVQPHDSSCLCSDISQSRARVWAEGGGSKVSQGASVFPPELTLQCAGSQGIFAKGRRRASVLGALTPLAKGARPCAIIVSRTFARKYGKKQNHTLVWSPLLDLLTSAPAKAKAHTIVRGSVNFEGHGKGRSSHRGATRRCSVRRGVCRFQDPRRHPLGTLVSP